MYYGYDISDYTASLAKRAEEDLVDIFKKIEVADRTQAAVFAIKNNLIKI